MSRRIASILLLAALVTACGAARASTPDFTAELTTVATSTETTIAPPPLPAGIQIGTSRAIERPGGFPTLDELADLVAASTRPHPRALITSCLALTAGAADLEAQGIDTSGLDQAMKITYYDGLVVWEDDAGLRMVIDSEYGTLYEAEDGTWSTATGTEWSTVGPINDWSLAQAEASLVLGSDPIVVGYETVADTPTVRLLLIDGDDTAHLWIDETGAALRLVEDFAGSDGSSRWVGVWSVETLSPILDGEMP